MYRTAVHGFTLRHLQCQNSLEAPGTIHEENHCTSSLASLTDESSFGRFALALVNPPEAGARIGRKIAISRVVHT